MRTTNLGDGDSRKRIPGELMVFPFLALTLAAQYSGRRDRRHAHTVAHKVDNVLGARTAVSLSVLQTLPQSCPSLLVPVLLVCWAHEN